MKLLLGPHVIGQSTYKSVLNFWQWMCRSVENMR